MPYYGILPRMTYGMTHGMTYGISHGTSHGTYGVTHKMTHGMIYETSHTWSISHGMSHGTTYPWDVACGAIVAKKCSCAHSRARIAPHVGMPVSGLVVAHNAVQQTNLQYYSSRAPLSSCRTVICEECEDAVSKFTPYTERRFYV